MEQQTAGFSGAEPRYQQQQQHLTQQQQGSAVAPAPLAASHPGAAAPKSTEKSLFSDWASI
jgi:hypothetical protein